MEYFKRNLNNILIFLGFRKMFIKTTSQSNKKNGVKHFFIFVSDLISDRSKIRFRFRRVSAQNKCFGKISVSAKKWPKSKISRYDNFIFMLKIFYLNRLFFLNKSILKTSAIVWVWYMEIFLNIWINNNNMFVVIT